MPSFVEAPLELMSLPPDDDFMIWNIVVEIFDGGILPGNHHPDQSSSSYDNGRKSTWWVFGEYLVSTWCVFGTWGYLDIHGGTWW